MTTAGMNDEEQAGDPDSQTIVAQVSDRAPTRTKKAATAVVQVLRWPFATVLSIPAIALGGIGGAVLRGYRLIYNPGGGDGRADIIRAPAGVLWLGLLLLFGISAVHPFLPHFAEGSPAAHVAEIGRLFLAEVGVALIVSFVIAWGIDAQARRREELRQDQEREKGLERERRLTQDVFRSVLGIQHSTAYVQKVIETTLDRKIIRRSVNLMFSLSRLSDTDAADLDVIGDHFIWLDQAVSFEFENLSSEEQAIDVTCVVPARHGALLRNASRVLKAKIGGKDQDVAGALQPDNGSDAKTYVWKHRIPGFKTLPVSFTARVIKEQSDSDVWTSYYPCTEGITLQVHAPGNLHLGLRNNTASEAVVVFAPNEGRENESSMAAWKIAGPILPSSGVVFYWRTLEHDGDATAKQVKADTVERLKQESDPANGGKTGFFRKLWN